MFTASLILSFAAIAPTTRIEDASANSIAKLGFGYAATLLTVWMLMLLAISFYRISREDHAKNLAALAGKEAD